MASDSRTEVSAAARRQARKLAQALDAIEAELDTLELGASPEVIAKALAGPVSAFDAVAKEAAS